MIKKVIKFVVSLSSIFRIFKIWKLKILKNLNSENSGSEGISTNSYNMDFYRLAVQNYKSATCYRSKVKKLNQDIARLQKELKALRKKCSENSMEMDQLILV